MSKSTTAKRNRARGKEHQKAVANLVKGLNLGTLGGVDVLTKDFSIECKSRVKFVGYGWMDQAERHNKKYSKVPLVVIHQKGKRYTSDLVLLRITDFLELIAIKEERDGGKNT